MRTTILVIAFLPICVWANNFGYQGQPGRDGYHGADGRKGLSTTIVASGQNENLELSGESARDGQRGEGGQNAYSCYQPMNAPYNLEGADGGRGGDGGNGGNGGNGGDLTVYYTDLANVRRVYARSIPGRGAYGGDGSYGGRGCRCTMTTWTVNGQTYYCRSGSNGSNGMRGRSGYNGQYGTVVLINSPSALSAQMLETRVPFERILSQPYSLLRHLWEKRWGARLLFAAGSEVSDGYHFYLGTERRNVQFVWSESRPISDFTGKSVYLTLAEGKVEVKTSDGIWSSGQMAQTSQEDLQYTFDHVLYSTEANSLSLGKISGSLANAELEIIDKSNVSEFVGSTVKVRYLTKSGLFYHERWEGTVPASALTVSKGDLRVALGRLGIKQDFLASGIKARVFVWVNRTLGNHSNTNSMDEFYTISN